MSSVSATSLGPTALNALRRIQDAKVAVLAAVLALVVLSGLTRLAFLAIVQSVPAQAQWIAFAFGMLLQVMVMAFPLFYLCRVALSDKIGSDFRWPGLSILIRFAWWTFVTYFFFTPTTYVARQVVGSNWQNYTTLECLVITVFFLAFEAVCIAIFVRISMTVPHSATGEKAGLRWAREFTRGYRRRLYLPCLALSLICSLLLVGVRSLGEGTVVSIVGFSVIYYTFQAVTTIWLCQVYLEISAQSENNHPDTISTVIAGS